MPRNRRREKNAPSAGSVVVSVLSIAFFIALGLGVVILKAQRRAARNDAQFGRNDTSGGGGWFGASSDPQPSNPVPQNAPQPVPQTPQPKRLAPGVTKTEPVGGIFANNEYTEYREDGAVLIGFEVGLGAVPDTAVVTYLRPIWLSAKGEQFGTAYGRTKNPITTVKARNGYAIGGIRVHGGGAIEGICFTFMRRGEKHLIKDDFYLSPWCGEQTRQPPASDLRRGDGEFVIGIYGKRFEDKGGTEFHDSGCIGTIGLHLWVRP